MMKRHYNSGEEGRIENRIHLRFMKCGDSVLNNLPSTLYSVICADLKSYKFQMQSF